MSNDNVQIGCGNKACCQLAFSNPQKSIQPPINVSAGKQFLLHLVAIILPLLIFIAIVIILDGVLYPIFSFVIAIISLVLWYLSLRLIGMHYIKKKISI